MLYRLLATKNEYSTTVLRVALGVVMLPHGAQKLLGWFGGQGFTGTMHHFTENMGVPYLFALLAVLAESLGALGLIAGLFTRVAALGIGATIGVAALMVHVKHGFFMNWFGKQSGEGFEYHLLVVAMALVLAITGGGRWSLDGLIAKEECQRSGRR